MIERGIHTTKADWWAHIFPNEGIMYCYSVRHMIDWIADAKPVSRIGKSKDGSETGKGYLVKKSAPFILQFRIPEEMLRHFTWDDATDREKGLIFGEKIADWMFATSKARLPFFSVSRLKRKSEQLNLGDFGIQFSMPTVLVVEVKTESVRSENLYVQTHEQGHRVHQTLKNGAVVTRFTQAPAMEKG